MSYEIEKHQGDVRYAVPPDERTERAIAGEGPVHNYLVVEQELRRAQERRVDRLSPRSRGEVARSDAGGEVPA